MPGSKNDKLYCNSCKRVTNHEEKFRNKETCFESEEFHEYLLNILWMCMGCGEFVLQRVFYNDETSCDEEADIRYFPKLAHSELTPKTYSKLKPKLATLYNEAITCYNKGALILCAAGLRALLEGICSDKRVQGANLKKKINNLQSSLPNKNIIRNLHHFRFMGNEAVHELAAPKPTELALATSVIEDLLNFFYELDYKASQLHEMRRANKKRFKVLAKSPNSLQRWADGPVQGAEPVEEPPKSETV
jgi:hypothetical protein